jgi:predicted lipid-binding transport protein (Tim44 family)
MAQYNQPNPVRTVAAPQVYAPPTTREMRAHAVHRLQIGFLGLAAMVLLVGLANIIMNRVRLSDAAAAPDSTASAAAKGGAASDPLAEIGVAPAANPSSPAATGKTGR